MEKELNTDKQTALLELRGFFRDERSVFSMQVYKAAKYIRLSYTDEQIQMKATVSAINES